MDTISWKSSSFTAIISWSSKRPHHSWQTRNLLLDWPKTDEQHKFFYYAKQVQQLRHLLLGIQNEDAQTPWVYWIDTSGIKIISRSLYCKKHICTKFRLKLYQLNLLVITLPLTKFQLFRTHLVIIGRQSYPSSDTLWTKWAVIIQIGQKFIKVFIRNFSSIEKKILLRRPLYSTNPVFELLLSTPTDSSSFNQLEYSWNSNHI